MMAILGWVILTGCLGYAITHTIMGGIIIGAVALILLGDNYPRNHS